MGTESGQNSDDGTDTLFRSSHTDESEQFSRSGIAEPEMALEGKLAGGPVEGLHTNGGLCIDGPKFEAGNAEYRDWLPLKMSLDTIGGPSASCGVCRNVAAVCPCRHAEFCKS